MIFINHPNCVWIYMIFICSHIYDIHRPWYVFKCAPDKLWLIAFKIVINYVQRMINELQHLIIFSNSPLNVMKHTFKLCYPSKSLSNLCIKISLLKRKKLTWLWLFGLLFAVGLEVSCEIGRAWFFNQPSYWALWGGYS